MKNRVYFASRRAFNLYSAIKDFYGGCISSTKKILSDQCKNGKQYKKRSMKNLAKNGKQDVFIIDGGTLPPQQRRHFFSQLSASSLVVRKLGARGGGTPASRHRGHGRPGRPGDKADLATAGCHRGHGRPGRPGEKVDLADQAGCHPGSCPPGSTGASRRPGAHINCRSGTPTLHTSYVQAQSYPNGPTARGPVPTLRRDGSQKAHGRYHRRPHGCFVFCPLRQQRSFRIPLTNLDQHDGTTGPSLQPDWSFPASPVTITTFFFLYFLLREEFSHLLVEGDWVVGGGPVAAGEWRLRAVAAPPWVFPGWRGRAS